MTVTNKHPVACLERAAVSLDCKGIFLFPRQKEMRHSEVKRFFLLSLLLFPLHSEKVTCFTVLYVSEFLYVSANIV